MMAFAEKAVTMLEHSPPPPSAASPTTAAIQEHLRVTSKASNESVGWPPSPRSQSTSSGSAALSSCGSDRNAEPMWLPCGMLPAPYVVKNTFIHDSSNEGVPSFPLLDRQVQSCPLSRVPSMAGLDASSDEQHRGFAGVMAAALEENLKEFSEAMGDVAGTAPDDSLRDWMLPAAEPPAICGGMHAVAPEFLEAPTIVEPPVDDSVLVTESTQEIPLPQKACAPGSEGHSLGRCNPCAFLHTKGCTKGTNCRFCHLCTPGALKERKRQRRAAAVATAPSQPTT